VPLYVYSCRRCELEMEELYPLGQAPERGIRCPLCGGYFERDVALFHVGGRSQPVNLNPPAAAIHHGVNCACCTPPRRSTTDA
jgi:putative FmdB family regulatory protein